MMVNIREVENRFDNLVDTPRSSGGKVNGDFNLIGLASKDGFY